MRLCTTYNGVFVSNFVFCAVQMRGGYEDFTIRYVNDTFISTFMIGLLLHDTLNETQTIEEAVRRMPEALQNERLFRQAIY